MKVLYGLLFFAFVAIAFAQEQMNGGEMMNGGDSGGESAISGGPSATEALVPSDDNDNDNDGDMTMGDDPQATQIMDNNDNDNDHNSGGRGDHDGHGSEDMDTDSDDFEDYVESHHWVIYVGVSLCTILFFFFCCLSCCMCKEAFCRGKCKHCRCSRNRRRSQCQQQQQNNMQRRRAEYTELQQV